MRFIVLRNRLAGAARAAGQLLWAITPPLHDVIGASGLGLLGWGLWEWSPALAKVVVGALLIGTGVLRGRAAAIEEAGQPEEAP